MTQPPPALLLTRPRIQAERFAARCRADLGDEVRIVISPVLRIAPRDVEVDLHDLAGIVLTSENGVLALAGRDAPPGLVAYCVGDRTAKAAEAAGIAAVSAGGAVEDLIAMIREARPAGALLHLRGAESRGDLAEDMARAGIDLRALVAYDQKPADPTDQARRLLATDAPVVAPLFSPRSAVLLSAVAAGAQAQLRGVALSQAVADAWDGSGQNTVRVAERPDAEAMLAALLAIYTGKLA